MQASERLCNVIRDRAAHYWPQGYDVSEDAPGTFETLQAEHKARGKITVWDGASDQTIFPDAATNYAFRAWHDAIHLAHGFGFTLEGEYATCCVHVAEALRAGLGFHDVALICAEVYGQAEHMQRTGDFIADQAAFDAAYIRTQRATIARIVRDANHYL